jgi:chromosome segregation ATPase
MNDAQQVAFDFNRLLKAYPGLFKGISALVEQIAQYGSIEQAIIEVQKQLDATTDARAKALEEIEQIKADGQKELDIINVKINEAVANQQAVEQQTAEHISAASDHAASIIESARSSADAQAEGARKEAESILSMASDRASRIDAVTAEKQAKLDTINAAVASQQAKLDTITTQIADVRTRLAQLTGG